MIEHPPKRKSYDAEARNANVSCPIKCVLGIVASDALGCGGEHGGIGQLFAG